MFWHDIDAIKERMQGLHCLLLKMDQNIEKVLGQAQERSECKCSEEIRESLEDAFCSDNVYSSINRINEKLNTLIEDVDRERAVVLAQKTIERFEDYMKNVDKLHTMINEFKGCVSIARAAIADKKEMDEMRTILKNMIETCQKYYNYQKNVSDQYFKIDAIYKSVCDQKEEEKVKPKKPKRKPSKVKKASPPAQSE
jgi:hypothetical protein